jgi:hypothetical protein
MDHPCHKCGHSIEDGKAFCSQCGAPQIRVAVADVPIPPPLANDRSAHSLALEAEPMPSGIPLPLLPASWSQQIRPCALAAGIAVVPMFFGVNPFVAALGAGFLAVILSRRGSVIRPALGAKFGALSGVLLFSMSTVLELLAVAVLHKGSEIRSAMMEKIQQAAARYPGPEVQPFLDFVKTSDGFAIMLVASLVFGLVAFVVLGGCGGALGAAFLGKRDRP